MLDNNFIKNILFFTGGTALREIATEFSQQSDLKMINIVTTFDSGGSSAEIRKEFNVLAIGDIRNRIISLIIKKNDINIIELLRCRFSSESSNQELQLELNNLIDLHHPLFQKIKKEYRVFFIKSLKNFNDKKSSSFKLQNGSIGNFIILGNYLETNDIYITIENICNLLDIKDEIIPIIGDSYHLKAILENKKIIFGQHNITAKETSKLNSPIKEISLNITENMKIPTIKTFIKEKIEISNLIIYPIGSFYTSFLANFLPNGVSDAIKKNISYKVYIPNTFFDSELNNRALSFQINEILKYLKATTVKDCLTHIVIDKNHTYPFELDYENIFKSIKILKLDIINRNDFPKLSGYKIVKELRNLLG